MSSELKGERENTEMRAWAYFRWTNRSQMYHSQQLWAKEEEARREPWWVVLSAKERGRMDRWMDGCEHGSKRKSTRESVSQRRTRRGEEWVSCMWAMVCTSNKKARYNQIDDNLTSDEWYNPVSTTSSVPLSIRMTFFFLFFLSFLTWLWPTKRVKGKRKGGGLFVLWIKATNRINIWENNACWGRLDSPSKKTGYLSLGVVR